MSRDEFLNTLLEKYPEVNQDLLREVLYFIQTTFDEKLNKAVQNICEMVVLSYDRKLADSQIELEKLKKDVNTLFSESWSQSVL